MYLVANPNASTRELADAAGVSDEAEATRLLARMEELGLISSRNANSSGAFKAWQLTADGRRLVQAIESRRGDQTTSVGEVLSDG